MSGSLKDSKSGHVLSGQHSAVCTSVISDSDEICHQCGTKFKPEEESKALGCDYCPRWYHDYCVGDVPKKKWRCSFCLVTTSYK